MKRSCSSLEDDTLDSTKRSCPRLDVEQVRARLRRAAEEECVPGSAAYASAELQAHISQLLAPLLRDRPTYVPAASIDLLALPAAATAEREAARMS